MESLLDTIGQLMLQYPAWSHLILGVATIIQGELAVFAAVYLVVSGSLGWFEYLYSTAGILFVAEFFIYLVGRNIRTTRFGWRLSRRMKENRKVQLYTYYLKQNMQKLFVISKFLPGTNLVIILLTGWSKTKLGSYLKSYLTSLLLWFGSMTALAYLLTSELHQLKADKVFREVEYVIGGVVIIIVVGEHFLRKAIRRAAHIEEVPAESEEPPADDPGARRSE
ncbi:MAG: hypothetical protein Q7S84_01540 [bacterium]|nr:hypothetical protein [bacterium]